MDTHIGAVVAIGVEAVVGDVAVAAVAISEKTSEPFSLDFEYDTANGDTSMWVVHKKLGRLFSAKVWYDRNAEVMRVTPEKSLIGYGNIGYDVFKTLVDSTDFLKVVGFCPTTISDVVDRTALSIRNLEMILMTKFGDLTVHKSGGLNIPEGATPDQKLSAARDDIGARWRCRHLSSGTMVEIPDSVSDSTRLQLCLGSFLAEAIATGVRAVRMLDLDIMYPSLGISENWGFGSDSLYRGLVLGNSALAIDRNRGIRGQLTDAWIRFWEAGPLSMPGTPDGPYLPSTGAPVDDPAFSLNLSCTGVSADDDIAFWTPTISSSPKGHVIAFSRQHALKMLELVEPHRSKFDTFTDSFTTSIKGQLDRGRVLSGRQMFTLYSAYKKHVI